MQRSPISNTNATEDLPSVDHKSSSSDQRALHTGDLPCSVEELIAKARKDEEEELRKCKEVLRGMLAATRRQRNISADVKRGILLMEESLEVIANLRKSWISAEGRCTKQQTQATGEVNIEIIEGQAAGPAQESFVTTPTTNKRGAASPVEQNTAKRMREANSNEWQKVKSRKERKAKRKAEATAKAAETPGKRETAPSHGKRKRKRRPKTKRDALLIKPTEGKTYAEVLSEIRSKVNPEDTGTDVRSIRQTRTGEVLLELGNTSKNKSAFSDALQHILAGKAVVRSLEPKETLEIRDLDSLTTKEEIQNAIKRDLKELAGEVQVSVTKANSREQKIAIVQLNARGARELLKAQHIRIGWVRCRVRERVVVPRCFRCLGYGHMARTCKGPDRSRACYKCGEADHKAKECSATERCVLCLEEGLSQSEQNHVPGSGRCRIFRDELEKARKLLL